jgi:YD repeat-containing protein
MIGVSRGGKSILQVGFAGNRLASLAGPAGTSVAYTYDPAGNHSGLLYSNGETVRLERDLLGRVTRGVDRLGHAWTMQYTQGGQLARVEQPDSTAYRYGYDSSGLLLATITDPRGGVRRMEYDSENRIVRMVDALGRATEFS